MATTVEIPAASAPPASMPDPDMALIFTRAEEGGWNVHPAGEPGVTLGRVFRYRSGRGWWTQMPGEHAMQCDSKTRAAAARRIPACLHTRWLTAPERTSAPVPDGFALVDSARLNEGDEVMTLGSVRADGTITEWRGPVRVVDHVIRPNGGPGAPVVCWRKDAADSQCWPWIAVGQFDRFVRRVVDPLALPCGGCGAEPGERCFDYCTARS